MSQSNCLQCASEFETKSNKKFCSKKCSDKFSGLKNKDKKSEYDRLRHLSNPEATVKRTKEWRLNNPGKRWEAEKKALEKSPQKRMYKSIMTVIKVSLKNNANSINSKTFKSLGFTHAELKTRLLSTMPENYNWSDFVSGVLQIDHIKPHSLFTYSSVNDDQFKECWSLSNLQLLTAIDNNKKQNKYNHE